MIQKLEDAGLLIVIGPPALGRALRSNENVGKVIAALGHPGRPPLGNDAQGSPAFSASVKKENNGPLFFRGRVELFGKGEEIWNCLIGGDLEGVLANFTWSWLSGLEAAACEE
jgi:hypothetical protein